MAELTHFPPPPALYDAGWGAALIQALQRAEIDRLNDGLTYAVGASRLTGQRWTDGRAIWTRVVPITKTFVETNATAIAHGIADVAVLVRLAGAWVDGSDVRMMPWTNGTAVIGCRSDATNVVSTVVGGLTWPNFASGHIILEFTRT